MQQAGTGSWWPGNDWLSSVLLWLLCFARRENDCWGGYSQQVIASRWWCRGSSLTFHSVVTLEGGQVSASQRKAEAPATGCLPCSCNLWERQVVPVDHDGGCAAHHHALHALLPHLSVKKGVPSPQLASTHLHKPPLQCRRWPTAEAEDGQPVVMLFLHLG